MRVCVNCGSDKTYLQKGKWESWYKHKDGYLCHNCHALLWNKNNPDRVKINSLNRINPKGKKNVSIGFNPRKGVCSKCGFKGKTDIHHIAYHNDLLKDTVELCRSCHSKITRLENPPTPRDPLTGRFIRMNTIPK